MIELSKQLNLPLDAVTQTFGYSARKGAGKSYAASKVAEGMLQCGAQVIIFDPVGNWFGLRLTASGKPSGLPIYIFGGEHADVPLDAAGARDLARVLASEPLSAILDVSEMRKSERQQFCAQFAEEFFHQKKSHRTPVHLFIEEAQLFVPQQVQGDMAAMVGAFEDIVRLGRNYGIGASLISQRPQSVNKQVLSQVECLIVLQTTGPHERKAIDDWVSEHGVDRKLVGELPSLPVGAAYVWSPSWLRRFERVKIAPKTTFDASSTPVVGEERKQPKSLAPADLDRLRSVMTDAVKKADESDPKKLRARIVDLQQQLDAKGTAEAAAQAMNDARREASDAVHQTYMPIIRDIGKLAADLALAVETLESARVFTECNLAAARPTVQGHEIQNNPVVENLREAKKNTTNASRLSGNLPRPRQAILDGLAWLEAVGLDRGTRTITAFLADASPRSSAFVNNLGGMRTAGLIEYPSSGDVCLTAEGRKQAAAIEAPRTPQALHQMIYAKLPNPQTRILQALIKAYPRSLDREQLAHQSGASPSSSAYVNNLGALRSFGFIDYPGRGEVVALPILFLEG